MTREDHGKGPDAGRRNRPASAGKPAFRSLMGSGLPAMPESPIPDLARRNRTPDPLQPRPAMDGAGSRTPAARGPPRRNPHRRTKKPAQPPAGGPHTNPPPRSRRACCSSPVMAASLPA